VCVCGCGCLLSCVSHGSGVGRRVREVHPFFLKSFHKCLYFHELSMAREFLLSTIDTTLQFMFMQTARSYILVHSSDVIVRGTK
jgi:hypothetical protein